MASSGSSRASVAACEETYRAWHAAMSKAMQRGPEGQPPRADVLLGSPLRERIADDAEFSSPTFHRPIPGGLRMATVLTAVSRVFEKFQYHREWLSEDKRHWCLEFTAEVAPLPGSEEGRPDEQKKNNDKQKPMFIKGADLVTLDEHGRIVALEVIARPLSAVARLKERMGAMIPVVVAELQEAQQQQADRDGGDVAALGRTPGTFFAEKTPRARL